MMIGTFRQKLTSLYKRSESARSLIGSILAVLILFSSSNAPVFAAFAPPTTEPQSAPADVQSYHLDTVLYSITNCNGAATGADASLTIKPASGVWVSHVPPPYTLEQFMIQVLKDIAAKTGAPESDVVTEQHVIALVAFAYGEGGNITNLDIWNPLNTGLNNPDLVDGSHSSSGLQSFKSFDAGVEATAITMTTPNQDRLAQILTHQSSTAIDFMHTLTYYQNYPHNFEWAKASMPPHQDSYYAERVQLVQQVTANYRDIASLQLGPPGYTETTLPHKPELLVYNPSGAATGGPVGTPVGTPVVNASCATGTDPGSTAASANGLGIAARAIQDSWLTNAQGATLKPKPEYSSDICQYNKDYCSGSVAGPTAADCGIFVATIMHATGSDPHYPGVGTSNQANYVLKHPELYAVVALQLKTTAPLLPGDILLLNAGSYIDSNGKLIVPAGAGGSGHTMIWTGPQPSTKTNVASASLDSRMPNLGVMDTPSLNDDPRGYYLAVRFKGSIQQL